MPRDILFLLASPFPNPSAGPEQFYCPECATLEGLLTYQPELQKVVDIRRIAFPRPRPAIVDLLGTDLQSAPVLVVGDEANASAPGVQRSPVTKRAYVAGLRPIADYLTAVHHAHRLHP